MIEWFLVDSLGSEERGRMARFSANSAHGSLFQHPDWPATQGESRLTPSSFFWGEEDGRIRASAVIRRHVVPSLGWSRDLVVRGPVADELEVLRAAICALEGRLIQKGSAALTISPYWIGESAEEVQCALREIGYSPVTSGQTLHSWTLEVDLCRPLDAVFAGFSSHARSSIRRAEKQGLRMAEALTHDDIGAFASMYQTLVNGRGASRQDPAFFQRILDNWSLTGQSAKVLLSLYDGRPVGGVVILRHGERAVYTFGASDHSQRTSADKTKPLLWESMKWAKSTGCRVFDLGGYTPLPSPGSPAEGINSFKRSFSDVLTPVVCEHRKVFSPLRLSALMRAEATVRRLRRPR